ncbi:MAG: PEP-CTERM sorting domain-containing protein [Candidatus Rokubacteria bacterium]|nr:PEP-CTERM sorting domain-containing protein [Candidatus Rokubacteria bacterium]
MAVLLGLVLLLVTAPAARAASVTALYLLSAFSTSPSYSGGVTTPFTLTGTAGVSLGLSASAVAISQSDLAGPVSASIDATVTYQSHKGVIDWGEGPVSAASVNSEVGWLDDVGFVAEGGGDAKLNIDFTYHAKVILKIPTGGFTSLMIAEDAGLDPFKLQRCTDAKCDEPRQLLFDGFDSDPMSDVLARGDFGSGDISPIDQVYLFLFDAPLDGWLRISETKKLGGTRLEVDFVGGLDPPVPVPEPTTFLLWGTTAAGLGLIRWRRRRRRRRAHR